MARPNAVSLKMNPLLVYWLFRSWPQQEVKLASDRPWQLLAYPWLGGCSYLQVPQMPTGKNTSRPQKRKPIQRDRAKKHELCSSRDFALSTMLARSQEKIRSLYENSAQGNPQFATARATAPSAAQARALSPSQATR